MGTIGVVYASRHRGTEGIARRVAEVLVREGLQASWVNAENAPDASTFDACIVGSGVYMGSWLKDGVAYLERNRESLAGRPTWLFSSGPLPGSTKEKAEDDEVTSALGPAVGPGSGGRQRIEGLSAAIHPRGHRVFRGAFDPTDPPKALSERLVRMMPGSKGILPVGDFRDWDAIEAWARDVGAELRTAVAGE